MIRMAEAVTAPRVDGRHRVVLAPVDDWSRLTHQVGAALLGLAVFAGVAGIATLLTDDEQARGHAFACGLLLAAVVTTAVALWTNRKRTR